MLQVLTPEFYRRKNVTLIARELLGKILETRINGIVTAARIVETEAYNGKNDRASHAFGGRRTKRTEIMYADGGLAYIYLCYGIHHLFNVVTNDKDVPHAVLIRAGEPLTGIPDMLIRTGKKKVDFSLTRGPGNLSKALGIFTSMSGSALSGNEIRILDDGTRYTKKQIGISPRIGVDYAGDDARLPYRFFVLGNSFVSGSNR